MMNRITVLLTMMLMSTNAMSDWRDPNHKFDMSTLLTNKTTINVIIADNIQQACERESRRVGNNGFDHQVQACAFWQKDTCTVILPRRASMHNVGHEFMHCIKGAYH
jgi:hypothetical protein